MKVDGFATLLEIIIGVTRALPMLVSNSSFISVSGLSVRWPNSGFEPLSLSMISLGTGRVGAAPARTVLILLCLSMSIGASNLLLSRIFSPSMLYSLLSSLDLLVSGSNPPELLTSISYSVFITLPNPAVILAFPVKVFSASFNRFWDKMTSLWYDWKSRG